MTPTTEELLREILKRLVRVETRLMKLMERAGINSTGKSLKSKDLDPWD
jgi:hypothetical protein